MELCSWKQFACQSMVNTTSAAVNKHKRKLSDYDHVGSLYILTKQKGKRISYLSHWVDNLEQLQFLIMNTYYHTFIKNNIWLYNACPLANIFFVKIGKFGVPYFHGFVKGTHETSNLY